MSAPVSKWRLSTTSYPRKIRSSGNPRSERYSAWGVPATRAEEHRLTIRRLTHSRQGTRGMSMAALSEKTRILSKQWQGEFCRCSIDVVGGKQCDGGVDHVERFRHNTGPSAKAGKPMTQPTVDPLNRHRFILADVVPPNRQERVVRPIIVCTVQRDAPGFCYAAPALLRSLSSAAPATGSTWRHHDCHIPSR